MSGHKKIKFINTDWYNLIYLYEITILDHV